MLLKDLFYEMPDMALFREDHAINANITLPDFNPSYAKIVGSFDGQDVWASRFFGPQHLVFAFREQDTVKAFIVTGTAAINGAYPLERVWCNPAHQNQGLVSALILFVTKKMHHKLLIGENEPLTPEGWGWLTKLVQRGKVTATNAKDGTPVNADVLISNRKQGTATDLAVVLESTPSPYPLFANGYRQLQESIYVIGDSSLN